MNKEAYLLEAINQSATTHPPLQLRDAGDILRADRALDVDRVGLDLLEVGDDVGVVVLHSVLLAVAPEGEEVAAERVRVRRLRVVLALVQQILKHLIVPTGEVIAVENLGCWQRAKCYRKQSC